MIPNIIKGTGISGAIRYNIGEGNDKETGARKTLAKGAKSRSEILGGQNFGFEIDSLERVDVARRVMEFNGLPWHQASKTKRTVKDCLHVSLSWSAGEKPSDDEMREAARSFLKAMGMEGAQAIYFVHRDTPQPHLHIVASRIDPLTGRTFRDTRDKTFAQAWALKWEREHNEISAARQGLHRLRDAARAEDWSQLANLLSERNPTFTAKELERALAYAGMDGPQLQRAREKVLADQAVIGLRETATDPISRYTTRDVLLAERAIQRDARTLAGRDGFAFQMDIKRDAAELHKLNRDQLAALDHATEGNGFAMIAGQAGTGKSRAMAAIRDSYQAAGFKVVGLSWQNSVVEEMRANGFGHAATISRELGLQADPAKAPAQQWDQKTVVMVDEAAMLSTKDLAAVMAQAQETGAKVILAGDDRQLSAIERGGMYAPLRAEHGAAEITEVQRVKKASEREAWSLMHKGEFRPAMGHFETEGALHFAADAKQAEKELVAGYARDAQADPAKSRFIFAHTNAEVDRLNGMARALARESGSLGTDHQIKTAHGEAAFAKGDRIQFTGNGQSRQGREAGFVNGAVGTVTMLEIEGKTARLGVQLDNGKQLSFAVGDGKGAFDQFRHGYAGTIHKGQGKTIDQTYVLVSQGWKAEASYVAMTRHRESVSVHIPKDLAGNADQLGALMSRADEKRAASGFTIDAASLARSGLVAKEREQAAAAAAASLRQARGAGETGNPAGKQPPAAAKPGPAQQARSGTEKGSTAARSTTASYRSHEAQASAKQAASAGKKGEGAAQSALSGAAKVAAKALDAVASILESLGKEGPTPEEKIENAKHDAETQRHQAAEAQALSDEERIAREQHGDRMDSASATMEALFPAETLAEHKMRLEREKRERENEDDRGRTRGR